LLACALVLVLAGIVYLNAIHNPFVYDDQRLILANTSLLHLRDWRALLLHEVTRPVVNVSYAIDHAMWGQDPFGYHLTSVMLHLVNTGLVYLLAWRITDDRSRRGEPSNEHPRPQPVAFATALLFAIHPMMTEAVGYVAGRSEELCALF